MARFQGTVSFTVFFYSKRSHFKYLLLFVEYTFTIEVRRVHRKILNLYFHFKILENTVPLIQKNEIIGIRK